MSHGIGSNPSAIAWDGTDMYVAGTNGAGMTSLAIDLNQVPQPTGLISMVPFESSSFQACFHDAVGGVPTSRFSDGTEVAFN